jgi:hypothetical protein
MYPEKPEKDNCQQNIKLKLTLSSLNNKNQRIKHIQPMCNESSYKAADRMGYDSLGCEFTVT